jgi:hypothetical protein
VALSCLAFLGGLVVLFLTFWFTYAIIWFAWFGVSAVSELALGKRLHLSHEARLICSGVFIFLLFVQHFRTRPEYWGDYPHENYVPHPGLVAMSGAMGSLASLLAHPGASTNMIADILLAGPRLVVGSVKLAGKAFQIRKLDEGPCSQLLSFLLQNGKPVPYAELQVAGWEPWFEQMRCIEGVIFFEKGLGLSGELRQELNRLLAS